MRIGLRCGNDLDQVHVARRIEEVHAAEARAHISRAGIGQLVDRQAGGIGGENRVFAKMRRYLVVQVGLPVDAFGDRLDNQIAILQQSQVFIVVGRRDVVGAVLAGQRRGLELFQPVDGPAGDGALVAFFRRQIEKQGRDLGVDQMCGDLRPHHSGAEHGHLAYDELGLRHGFLGCSVALKQ